MHKSSISSPNKYTSQLLGCAFFSVDKFKSQKLEMLEVKNYIHLLLLKSFLSRYLPRWQHRLLNSPPPQTQQIYNYIENNYFWNKSRNELNDSYRSDEWENTHTEIARKGWDTFLSESPHWYSIIQSRKKSKIPASPCTLKGLDSTFSTPTFKTSTQMISPQSS